MNEDVIETVQHEQKEANYKYEAESVIPPEQEIIPPIEIDLEVTSVHLIASSTESLCYKWNINRRNQKVFCRCRNDKIIIQCN